VSHEEVTMADKSESRTPAPAYADPFQAFRAEMDKLAETFFGRGMMPTVPVWRAGWGVTTDGVVMPSIDLKEDDGNVVLTAELPGMSEKDIDVEVKNGVLTLTGEKQHTYEDKKDDVQIMERRYGHVQRSLRLPESVDPDKINAKFENGVLTVTMAKKPEAAPAAKKIAIGR
jgi:HSP20 family protein